MPPKVIKKRPDPADQQAFLQSSPPRSPRPNAKPPLPHGRATERRLNAYEYENALRDLLHAPWLQIKGQFPEDGEAYRFNKSSNVLDVSHVHVARYMSAADYAIRQVMSVQKTHPPTANQPLLRARSEQLSRVRSTPRTSRATAPPIPFSASSPQPRRLRRKQPL